MMLTVKNVKFFSIGLMCSLALSACSSTPVHYSEIKPKWEAKNSPFPVPKPRLKPRQAGQSNVAVRQHRGRTVTVQQGVTLYKISRITKVPVKTLIQANGLKAPFRVNRGQVLSIPALSKHTVKRGETLYAISRNYGVDVRTLALTNGLKAPYGLVVGQTLSISGSKASSGAKKTSTTQQAVAKRKKARTQRRASAVPAQQARGFLWPVTGPMLSSFGAKANGIHNDGINIKVNRGTSIKSAESGLVAYVGNELGGWGNLVLIKHSGGWVTAYAHADSVLVNRGDIVKRGQVIAKAGSTGHVASPQVHFELRRYKRAINPTRYLNKIGG